MDFLKQVRLIQGGMGVYVSNWRLARAVATEHRGKTAGTVSGTALDVVYVRLLQLGDPGGHVRRALAAFDAQFGVTVGQRICARYFVAGGKAPEALVRTTLVSPTGFAFKVVQLTGTLADEEVFARRQRICDIGLLQQVGVSGPDEHGRRTLFQRCAAGPVAGYLDKRGLARNTEGRRCLCNGLLATVGLGQIKHHDGQATEEPAIVTLGDHLDGVRRLSRNGQVAYWAKDVVADILGLPTDVDAIPADARQLEHEAALAFAT